MLDGYELLLKLLFNQLVGAPTDLADARSIPAAANMPANASP